MTRIRVAAAQLDLVVGDLDGNVARLLDAYADAQRAGCDLVVFPELAITGYPPEDLLLKPSFVAAANEATAKFAARVDGPAAVVGFPEAGARPANAAAMCADGEIRGVYRKHLLPNYDVFDEQRYFAPSTDPGPLFVVAGVRVAVSICEDAWSETSPILAQAAGGAEIVVSLNASPYYAGRLHEREAVLAARATAARVPIVYVNLVGGQDELVFDGASMVVDANGAVVARARQFTEDLLVVDVEVPRRAPQAAAIREVRVSDARIQGDEVAPRVESPLAPVDEVYRALVLGTRDYVAKNGFTDVVIGLSGGIDSALVAAIACDALGAEHVVGVLMPSRFSSEGSVSDADDLARNLGMRTLEVPIEEAHRAFLGMLADELGTDSGLAIENLQARIRGTILMTLSNQFGWLVLTTGNKSEMATGYTTLCGDMAGGFAVIKDVPKMLVYALARERNEHAGRALIPDPILEKPPSAELRPDQRDSDSLPDYAVLDPIVEGYVERDLSVGELVDAGFDPDTVRRVGRLVDRNEYKRRQAPPGVRVSPKAFGKDRRLPITNRWPG